MPDLDKILAEVSSKIPHVPAGIRITWAPAEELDHDRHWAQWRRYREDGHWIGIHEKLRKAPLYVLRYLVAHEVLHVVFPPRGRCLHPKAHRVAEALWPDYERANRWLEKRV